MTQNNFNKKVLDRLAKKWYIHLGITNSRRILSWKDAELNTDVVDFTDTLIEIERAVELARQVFIEELEKLEDEIAKSGAGITTSYEDMIDEEKVDTLEELKTRLGKGRKD